MNSNSIDCYRYPQEGALLSAYPQYLYFSGFEPKGRSPHPRSPKQKYPKQCRPVDRVAKPAKIDNCDRAQTHTHSIARQDAFTLVAASVIVDC
ncbi:hypothetical protein [Microcoleus sp.]|uniref:hypothetical protein n=1 Tax=Microcoleus sp. TaxID=44472 RepID=UPI0035937400